MSSIDALETELRTYFIIKRIQNMQTCAFLQVKVSVLVDRRKMMQDWANMVDGWSLG